LATIWEEKIYNIINKLINDIYELCNNNKEELKNFNIEGYELIFNEHSEQIKNQKERFIDYYYYSRYSSIDIEHKAYDLQNIIANDRVIMDDLKKYIDKLRDICNKSQPENSNIPIPNQKLFRMKPLPSRQQLPRSQLLEQLSEQPSRQQSAEGGENKKNKSNKYKSTKIKTTFYIKNKLYSRTIYINSKNIKYIKLNNKYVLLSKYKK
jgi:hypothetical protein